MAGAIQGTNHGRRLSLQSVVQYPDQAADSLDKDTCIIKDTSAAFTEERISFVVNSNTLKPASICANPPAQPHPAEFTSFQAIIFVNDKPIGKLVDPCCHFEEHKQTNSETLATVGTVQVAHLTYSKWQVAHSQRKACSTVQPLRILLREQLRIAQIRIQLIGRQFGEPVAVPAYVVSGKSLFASVATQRQLVAYIQKQHNRFSEGSSESSEEPAAVKQSADYRWQTGCALKGCSLTLNILEQPPWVKQIEIRVPWTAQPPLDDCSDQSSSAPPAFHSSLLHPPTAPTNSCPAAGADRMAARLTPAKLAATADTDNPFHTGAGVAAKSNIRTYLHRLSAADSLHTRDHLVLREDEFPPLPASRNHSKRGGRGESEREQAAEDVGHSGSSPRLPLHAQPLMSTTSGNGSSQPTDSGAGNAGDAGNDNTTDNQRSSQSTNDGSNSSASSSGVVSGRGGAKQGSGGGAGGNDEDDDFRQGRPQCGAGRAVEEAVTENGDDKDTDNTSEVTFNATDRTNTTPPSTLTESNRIVPLNVLPAAAAAAARKVDAQVSHSSETNHATIKTSSEPHPVVVSPTSAAATATHPSTLFHKQVNARLGPKTVLQVNGRHRSTPAASPTTGPDPTPNANGFSDAAVLERLLAESPIAFLTQDREVAENGFGDGGSTSSDEGSAADSAAAAERLVAGVGSSPEQTAQAGAASVDVFDSKVDFRSKRKFGAAGSSGRGEVIRKQSGQAVNGAAHSSGTTKGMSARRHQHSEHDSHAAQTSSRYEAAGPHTALPEVQPVPVRDPRGMSDLERFLEQATPYLKLNPSNPDLINTLCLEDVWRFYHEPSLYGREVLTYGGQRGTSFSYFVPYLSAIQLFVPALPGDPGTDRLYECDVPDWQKYMHMVYEFFDQDPPFNRPPMFVRMEMLSNCGSDSRILAKQRIKELHPCSWYAVAWYPVYRIPDAPLTARFLTFHSFAPLVNLRNYPPALDSLPLAVSGLKWYNMMNDRWFENLSDSTSRNEQALEEGSNRSLRKNFAPSSIDPEWQRHLEELQSTADRLARGTGLRVLGKMGPENVELYHPDWRFFNGRS